MSFTLPVTKSPWPPNDRGRISGGEQTVCVWGGYCPIPLKQQRRAIVVHGDHVHGDSVHGDSVHGDNTRIPLCQSTKCLLWLPMCDRLWMEGAAYMCDSVLGGCTHDRHYKGYDITREHIFVHLRGKCKIIRLPCIILYYIMIYYIILHYITLHYITLTTILTCPLH